jgi:iron complex transport system substrate-binding protein
MKYGLLGFLWLCTAAHSLTLTDARGKPVQLAQPAQRVVSLLPSLTESVCALGSCSRLVGVDRYSNYPQSVKKLPQLGGGLDVNIEAVVKTKPDLVLLSTSSRVAERLEQLGLKVLALEPQSHAQARQSLELLDKALGTQSAGVVWQHIERDFEQALAQVPAQFKAVPVYFEIDRTPYAAGEASFIGETMARLGLQNIVGKELGAFPKINPELVVTKQPAVIFLSARHAQELPKRPGWAGLQALQKGKVCEFTPEQGDLLVRSGPRMAQGAQVLVNCLKKLAK